MSSQREYETAQIQISDQTDLSSFQLQNSTFVVGKLNYPRSDPQSCAGSCRAIHSRYVGRSVNMDNPPVKARLRQAEDKTRIYATN